MMKRRSKNRRRWYFWAAASGFSFGLVYRWASRDPKWIRSRCNWTGYPETTGYDHT